MDTDEQPWTWKQRIRDPRFPAFLCLMLAGALLGSATFGFDGAGLTVVLMLGVVLDLLALPRWRDPNHSPRAGAAVLLAGAALVGAAAWLVQCCTSGGYPALFTRPAVCDGSRPS